VSAGHRGRTPARGPVDRCDRTGRPRGAGRTARSRRPTLHAACHARVPRSRRGTSRLHGSHLPARTVVPGAADSRERPAGARHVHGRSSHRCLPAILPPRRHDGRRPHYRGHRLRCERDATLRAASDRFPERTGLPIRQQRESRWTRRPARPGCAHCSAPTTRLPSWAQRELALPRLVNAVARLPTGSEPGTRDRSAHPKALSSG
jgi:hypothetical protein